jgi:hypothetical protein
MFGLEARAVKPSYLQSPNAKAERDYRYREPDQDSPWRIEQMSKTFDEAIKILHGALLTTPPLIGAAISALTPSQFQ